jgi:serine/threonine-protein kinase
MTNNRWREVEEAYAGAANLPPGERAAFLKERYPDRPEICGEVESLVACKSEAARVIHSTIFDPAARDEDSGSKLIGSVIAGKYLVRERIGAGNMGEVFLADHLTLGIPFALKRPAPALRNDPGFRRRLIEEARRAVVLKHENIARVFDIIESGDDIFAVMEYIEGVTLRERLQNSGGRLPVSEFLPIATQCASALAAAHEKRIAHLDVKPENIMVGPGGQVKICDFGVARKLATEPRPDETTASGERWAFAGTPAYMAPEVVLSYQFDERADQFSLGIVFYEMLTGTNPFLADTVVATTARIVNDVPSPVRAGNPGVSAGLERIVMRLLSKDPDERYASTTELAEELESIDRSKDRHKARSMKPVAAALLLCLIALPAFIYGDHAKPWAGVSALSQKKIVVVLPFRVIGEARGERFYSDGISEILTGQLTRLTQSIADLQVIPAAETHARNVDSAARARAEFGATLVLAGTFQVSGDQVRVSYSLIDAARDRELRAGAKQLASLDPFAIQDAVIRDVMDMLELEFRSASRQGRQVFGTSRAEAYFLYTRGVGALQNFQETENIDQAIGLFRQATELDSDYAAAYAGLGQSYWRKFWATRDSAWLDQAETSCEKAASEDEQLSQAHTCLGLVDKSKGNYERAVEDFRRALAFEPTNDEAQRGLGTAYESWGRFDDAEQAYRMAINLRPQYWAGYAWLAGFYRTRRHNYQKAIDNYYRALAASPGNGQVYYALGQAYMDNGEYGKANSVLQTAVELEPFYQTYSNLGLNYLRSRHLGPAVPAFEKAASMSADYRVTGNLARIYWLTGQKEKARNEYGIAIDEAKKLLRLDPRDSDVHILVGRYYAMLGREPEARSHLMLALNANPADPHYLVIAAVSYLQLGDRMTALSMLDQAIAHETRIIDIQAEPELDVLVGDPRFIALTTALRRRN